MQLPSLERLPLAPRAPKDGRVAPTGVFVDAEDFVEPLPRPYDDYPALLKLSHQLMTNTSTLAPFVKAFKEPPPPPAEQRWTALEMLDWLPPPNESRGTTALSTIHAVRRWVKIGGKNDMQPQDVKTMLKHIDTIKQVLSTFRDDLTVGYVFDGDDYEPEKSPFTVIIKDLIDSNRTVVAIKTAERRMLDGRFQASVSNAFYNGWKDLAIAHPETFVMAIMREDVNKWDVTKKAHAFVYWGSNFESSETERNYRFETDLITPTQGWEEIQKLKNDNEMVCEEIGGVSGTFLAVRRDF